MFKRFGKIFFTQVYFQGLVCEIPCVSGLLQVSVPIFQSHQVLSDNNPGLGRGGTSSLPSGLQHAEPADSQKESQLSSSGLQLQSEASQDTHHKREKEVKIWECLPSLS